MAQKVGDLYPHASGTSSLGVDQLNGPAAGFTTDIRPFNHVHMNSGVLHDPLHGTSGVFRYDNDRGMEVSLDGGITFLPVVTDLQTAYDGGNEIDNTAKPPGLGAAAGLTTGHFPVLTKITTPGGGLSNDSNIIDYYETPLIAASGFSLTPNLRNTYAYTSIVPGGFFVQGSGTSTSPPAWVSISAANVAGIGSDTVTMSSSGSFFFNGIGAMGFTLTEKNASILRDLTFSNVGAPNFIGGQIKFNAFNGSGHLEYRFGPYESWHQRNSAGGNVDFHPIPHSGHVLQMILENGGGGGASSLQEAYEGGDEIALQGIQFRDNPVLIKETDTAFEPVAASDLGSSDGQQHLQTGALIVSGVSIGAKQSFLNRMGSNGFVIRGSGDFVAETFMGYAPLTFGIPNSDDFHIRTSGVMRVFNTGRNETNTGAEVRNITGSYDIDAGVTTWTSDRFSMVADGTLGQSFFQVQKGQDLEMESVGGKVRLDSFLNSGILEYQFGPYEAWHTPVGAGNSDLVPIPHSGHVLQMILENGGGGGGGSLQDAYDLGPFIATTANGPVSISGNLSNALNLSSLVHAPLNLSGVVEAPLNATSLGDVWFARHSLRPEHPSLGDLLETSEGLAGGIPSLWYHAGASGVINVRAGSGIIQIFNIPSLDFDDVGVFVPFRNTGHILQDRHFRTVANSGVKVFAEGLYRANYSVSIEKTDGNLLQQANTFLYVNDNNGNTFNITGGESFAQMRDSQDNTQNTANGQALFDIKAGETVNVFVQTPVAYPAPNQLRCKTRQASIILEFIGPARGTSQRSPVILPF